MKAHPIAPNPAAPSRWGVCSLTSPPARATPQLPAPTQLTEGSPSPTAQEKPPAPARGSGILGWRVKREEAAAPAWSGLPEQCHPPAHPGHPAGPPFPPAGEGVSHCGACGAALPPHTLIINLQRWLPPREAVQSPAEPCLPLAASHARLRTIPGRGREPFPKLDVFPGSQGQTLLPGLAGALWGWRSPGLAPQGTEQAQGIPAGIASHHTASLWRERL